MRKRIKVLFLADINSAHIERWYHQLTENNIEVGIFSLNIRKASWTETIPEENVYCVDLEVTSPKSKWKYFFNQKELRSFLKKFDPDIVHAHYASSYGMLANRLKFPKTVVSMWGSDVYEFPKRSVLHRTIFKRIIKNSQVVCSTSIDMVREAKLYVNRRYEVVPFGIDVKLFKPKEHSPGSFILGTVKTLEEVYGIDRLIRAYAFYTRKKGKSDSKLLIYGRGSQLDKLKGLVEELGLNENVEFKGFVVGEELIKAYHSLDVYLALSRRESFGVAVLEAQSCALPVIVSNVGGLPEVVSPENGFVVEGDNEEQIFHCLEQLTDAKVREEKGARSREFVQTKYSIQVSTANMLQIYYDLLDTDNIQ